MSQNKNAQKQITDILDQLTYTQQRFVVARLESDTDVEAARKIGISRETASRWPERELIKRAITLASLEAYEGARAILRRNAIKAAMVKVRGLDSADDRIAQQAAKEILEWTIDLPTQPLEWREEARARGYDPDQLYADMVNAARARAVTGLGDGSSGSRGVDGSTAAD